MIKSPFQSMNHQRLPHFLVASIATVFLLSMPKFSFALGTVQGFVRDGDGFAISGALVESTTGDTDITKHNGSYEIAHPEGGPYDITASATGYTAQVESNVSVTDGETTLVDFTLPGSPLQVEGLYPSLGKMGQPLNQVTITGDGFDSSTRVSVYVDSGNRNKIIGSAGTFLYAQAVTVKENKAYVADGFTGLHIIDITNPSQPYVLNSNPMSGTPRDIVVIDNSAYIAAESAGLLKVDVDPGSASYMSEVDSVDTTGSAYGVAVIGSTAYVADGESGLQVIDLDNFALPDPVIATVDTPGFAYDVTVSGNFAYVADGECGLQIIDLTQLAGPDPIIAAIDTPDEAKGVTVHDGMAYIAGWKSGLHIINVSNPNSPSLAASLDTPRVARKVTVQGRIAYVADDSSGLQIVDVSESSSPKITGSVKVQGAVYDVAVADNIAYVAAPNCGMQVIDITRPTQPTLIGWVITPGWAHTSDVVVSDNIAYVAANQEGLQVIDVDPLSPDYLTIIGAVDTPDYASGLALVGDRVYIADGSSGIQVIDVSDPTSPFILYSVDTPGRAADIKITSNIVFVADGTSSLLRLYSLPTLDQPTPSVFSVNIGDWPLAVDVAGNYAYMAGQNQGLHIIDLTTLGQPTPSIDTVTMSHNTFDVAVQGDYAYVANTYGGLQIVNINPGHFQYGLIIGSIKTPDSAVGIAVDGDIAYVADNFSGLQMIDITDRTTPIIIGAVETTAQANAVQVIGDKAYVAALGLVIVPLPVELTTFTVNSPTEITADIPAPIVAGNYTIRVFDSVEHDELFGAVTFTDNIDLLTSKAIIVAGGGPDASGDIWEETKAYANYAYNSLIYQGYLDKDIYYLTDETGALGRDAAATKENLKTAIEWAEGASGLLLYLVDHGASQEFQIHGGADMQTVSAFELDSWLTTLQKTMKGKVVIIYDACKSGSFISNAPAATSPRSAFLAKARLPERSRYAEDAARSPAVDTFNPVTTPGHTAQSSTSGNNALPGILYLLTSSGGDKDRIIITSSGSNQVAYFLNPSHSFSYHFWSTLAGKTGHKANLVEAFREASAAMSLYQTSQLDANGNGKANEDNDFSSLQQMEGTVYALRRQYASELTKPVVGIVSENQTLSGTSAATLTARNVYDMDGDAIVRVWAEIIRPDYNPYQGDLTVTDIPTVELTDPDDDRVYEGIYDQFDVAGFYIINYYAEDAHGIYSQPKTSIVIRN